MTRSSNHFRKGNVYTRATFSEPPSNLGRIDYGTGVREDPDKLGKADSKITSCYLNSKNLYLLIKRLNILFFYSFYKERDAIILVINLSFVILILNPVESWDHGRYIRW